MELEEVLLIIVVVQVVVGVIVVGDFDDRVGSLEQTQGLAVTVCNWDVNSNSILVNPNTGQPDCYRLNRVLEAQQARLGALEQNQVAIVEELQENTTEARE